MKRFNKLIGFVVAFMLMMVAFCGVSSAAGAQQFDLSKWQSIILNYADTTSSTPNWSIDTTKTSVTQTTNCKPAILLSDIDTVNKTVNGSLSVGPSSDNDYIGFVFGYKDSTHFYLFDWKKEEQGTAKRGMSIKVVNASGSAITDSLWNNTTDSSTIKVLYHNSISYNYSTLYNFTISFTDRGMFNITIKMGDEILDKITINDNTYTSGKFGFYNYSQPMVTYKGFTYEYPPTLEVVSTENAKINLAWDVVEGANSYILKRASTLGGPYTTITTTSDCTYSDTNLTNGTTYYYVVLAIINETESANSNEVEATPVAPPSSGILEITMTNGQIKEYDMTGTELGGFLAWYDNKSDDTGKSYYVFTKKNSIKPFLSRKEYIAFDKISSFEVNEYAE